VLADQFFDPGGWELQNMLCVGRLMIEAALERQETRGCHVRMDFPETDESWCRRIRFVKAAGAAGPPAGSSYRSEG